MTSGLANPSASLELRQMWLCEYSADDLSAIAVEMFRSACFAQKNKKAVHGTK